jgi:hypothetical protein
MVVQCGGTMWWYNMVVQYGGTIWWYNMVLIQYTTVSIILSLERWDLKLSVNSSVGQSEFCSVIPV